MVEEEAKAVKAVVLVEAEVVVVVAEMLSTGTQTTRTTMLVNHSPGKMRIWRHQNHATFFHYESLVPISQKIFNW